MSFVLSDLMFQKLIHPLKEKDYACTWSRRPLVLLLSPNKNNQITWAIIWKGIRIIIFNLLPLHYHQVHHCHNDFHHQHHQILWKNNMWEKSCYLLKPDKVSYDGRVWGFQHQEMRWEGYFGEVLNPLDLYLILQLEISVTGLAKVHTQYMAQHKAIYCELWWLDVFGWASLLLNDTICGLYVSCEYHKMKWNLICNFTGNKIQIDVMI